VPNGRPVGGRGSGGEVPRPLGWPQISAGQLG